jgi:flagellar hook-length control protein FliK
MPLAISLAMNTAPVIQTSVQLNVGASVAAGAGATANAGGAPSAFAGALNAAGAKPGRRPGASKQSDDGASGASLPPAGNQSPPPPLPQAAATPVAPPHAGDTSAADHTRMERGKASGSAPAENPLAVQAAGAAALIDGAKSLSGATAAGPAGAIGAAAGAATSAAAGAATNGATKNAAAPDTVGGQPAMKASIESGLTAKSAAPAVEASAEVAANAAAAVKPKAPAPIASLQSNPALMAGGATTLGAATTSDAATTPGAATTVGPSAGTSSAPATALAVASAVKATPAAAASAAADKAAAKPHPAALRSASQTMVRTAAPATGSGTAPADGGGTNSTLSTASNSSGDTSTSSGGAQAPVPAVMDTGAQDAAAMTAAAAAAVAGTPRLANTGKPSGDNSYDSDTSVAALGVGTEAAASAASAPLERSGMGAAAGTVVAPNAANAPAVADAAKPAHGGFDLAALAGGGDAAAGLSQLNANASVNAPADATPTAALKIHASVDSADFSQGLSDRVSWMVDNGVNGAKLQVNPPQLGPIELRISVQGDHAQVWMTTHSAVARDALESSSPKLREMLNAQGFGQVSVDISQRSFQDRSAYVPPYQREQADVHSAAVAPVPTAAASTPRSMQGALDAYA